MNRRETTQDDKPEKPDYASALDHRYNGILSSTAERKRVSL